MPKLSVSFALIAFLAATAEAQWKIPNPRTTDHPGVKDAPAADPRTFPDEKAFQERSAATLAALRTNNLENWRKGWFATGGDPGKYIPGPAMAMLLADPNDPNALKFMNDDRSHKEHYHFAAVNWGRFYPIFRDALTPETRRKLAQEADKHNSYVGAPGTENHKVMWYTTANVLPYYIEGDRFARMPKMAAVANRKAWLRQYVQRLYAAGQGEWDSSSYLVYDLNGMLNIYDFCPDQESRLLAKAVLDFYVAGYALKYTDGCYCGPNQRGHVSGPIGNGADRTGWLWWGCGYSPTLERLRGSLTAVHAITSGYRPSQVLCNLAHRDLPALPFEARNSKPSYWQGTEQPVPNQYRETVYVTRHYTMGTLWNGHGSQITRFNIVAAGDKAGAIAFTGGSPGRSDHTGKPIDFGYADGIGRWDQTCQVGPTHICLSRVPDDQEPAYAFFTLPAGATRPRRQGRWWFIQANKTYLAIHSLGGEGHLGETTLTEGQKTANAGEVAKGRTPRNKPEPILIFPGRKTGFVVETADVTTYATLDAFAKAVTANTAPDTAAMADKLAVKYRTLAGKAVEMRFDEDARQPAVSIDGKAVSYENWPVYDSPYLKLDKGVLTVNDGKEGFVVDCSGQTPVYKPWKP
jgi:hypothetical protein